MKVITTYVKDIILFQQLAMQISLLFELQSLFLAGCFIGSTHIQFDLDQIVFQYWHFLKSNHACHQSFFFLRLSLIFKISSTFICKYLDVLPEAHICLLKQLECIIISATTKILRHYLCFCFVSLLQN